MPTLTLKPVTTEDEMVLRQLYASVREEEIKSWGWTPAQQDAFIHMQWTAQQTAYRMQFPHAEHRLILQGQEPVGQYYVNYTSDHLRLIDISIFPSFRNRGIGSAILHKLQGEATRCQIPILLCVIPDNQARRLYERFGFIVVGAADMQVLMRWQPIIMTPHGEENADE